MRKRVTLAGAGLFGVLLLAGCGGNGWEAQPVNGDSSDKDTCYQITEWENHGFLGLDTRSWAKGVYCPAKVEPNG